MLTVTLDNSFSRITGLSADQDKELKKTLSYIENPDAGFYGGFKRRKSLLGKRGDFPTGLLHRIPSDLLSSCQIIDERKPPKTRSEVILTSKGRPGLWEWQKDATEAAICSDRGTISAPTGTGKSVLIENIIQRYGLKTLVVVPNLELKKQLGDTLAHLDYVRVENIDSKALNSLTDFDCLIIDEAHHVAARTYQRLNRKAWKGIYYRFFLTATPFRNQEDEQLLFEAIAGKVIYKLDYKTAISEGYIVPIEAYYIEVPTQKTEAYTWAQVYSELVVNNAVRNVMIVDLLTRLHAAGKSTLCLVKEVQHGRQLADISSLDFVHGSSDDRSVISRFNREHCKILIGTTGVLGEGVDTKPCEFVVIAGLGKAKSHFMQQIGRAVRAFPGKESAKIILIKDKSHKFTLRHFNKQKKILLDEYGVVLVKLNND